MPNPSKRFTANPLRPTKRYRPGKGIAEEESSSEEDSSDEEHSRVETTPQRQPNTQAKTISRIAAVAQEPSDDEEGFVTEEEDEAQPMVRRANGAPQGLKVPDTASELTELSDVGGNRSGEEGEDEEVDDDDDDDDDDEESSEEEKSSDDERQRRFQRPTFIKKTDRKLVNSSSTGEIGIISAASHGISQDDEEEARRKEMADLMIKDKLERDAAARAAGKKNWDDDDEVGEEDEVDDTDDLDPDAELAAWKVRELKRLKRDREAIEEHEREIAEKERRSNLTREERDTEDAERLAKQKEEREAERGTAGLLQRYHHKGAFFQDEETAEILRKRDLMGARYEDAIVNREALPEHMRNLRDMSKLGRKSNTRYKDLKAEDTGQWGEHLDHERRPGGVGIGVPRDVDERFRPDQDGGGRSGPTGANASAVIERRKRSRSPSTYDRDKRPRVEAA